MSKIKYASEVRKYPVSCLVFHSFGLTTKQMLAVFQKTGTSCHYLIQRNGKILALVDENQVAYHAGLSSWREFSQKINQHSIGIEIQNPKLGEIQYTKAQIQSLINLSKKIIKKYQIKPENIVGHSDIAPLRKPDPGRLFPWRELAQKGIGLWPTQKNNNHTRLSEAQIKKYLQQIGYETRDLNASLYAFAKRFVPHKVPEFSNVIKQEAKVFQYWLGINSYGFAKKIKNAPTIYPLHSIKLKEDATVIKELQEVMKFYNK